MKAWLNNQKQNKIKVLQVNKFYYPWIGGIETVVQDIAEGLKDKVDMTVLACQPKGKTVKEKINDIDVIKASSIGKYFSMPISFSFFKYFYKLSKNNDIVHLHMPFPLGDLACFLSRYKGKLVVWWHSDIVKQKKLMFFYKPLMNWVLRRANLIIVATEGHIKSSKYLKKYKDKCKIIPFGIDIKKYPKQNKKILTNLLYNKTNKKILFVGRLVYYKGIEVLIDAFKNIKNCELFIVGDGALKNLLIQKTTQYKIQNIVHFMGRLGDEDLRQAFSDCDIFVLPSIENSEAFGLVQLEAMVYEKPVINTSLPTGVPCVSLNKISGFTVRPGDPQDLANAISILANNQDLCIEMGKKGKERVEKIFNIKKMLDDILREYKNLL